MCFWFRIFIAFIVCAWAGAVVAVETKVYSQVNICNRNMTFSQKGYYKLMGALSRLSKETVKWKFPKLLTFLNKCFLCFFFHSHIRQWVTFCLSFFLEIACFVLWGIKLKEITHHICGTEGKQLNTWEIIEVTLNPLWKTIYHLINIVRQLVWLFTYWLKLLLIITL